MEGYKGWGRGGGVEGVELRRRGGRGGVEGMGLRWRGGRGGAENEWLLLYCTLYPISCYQ